jgi:hypothetical protein
VGVGGPEAIVILIWVGVFWVLPIVLASNIWTNKGGSGGAGFALGFFLGWIGVLIAAIATPSRALSTTGVGVPPKGAVRECPHCKESMRRDASVCPHCQRESVAWQLHQGHWWFRQEDGTQFYLDERNNQWIRFPTVPSAPESAPSEVASS